MKTVLDHPDDAVAVDADNEKLNIAVDIDMSNGNRSPGVSGAMRSDRCEAVN
jgi:hypothetical protein